MAEQQSISVSGPVQLSENSPERVALQLYEIVRQQEPQKQDEALELFARCLLTVRAPSLGVKDIKETAKGN
ncbi:MAG: hypothetical protein P8Y53_03885 [Pseudolabrys sp.]|jgi:hypothetical protein